MAETTEIKLTFDKAINYAFQQNAIPVVNELRFRNDATPRKNLVFRISTEPAFATAIETRLQGIDADGEFHLSPVDLKLSHDFLAELPEKVSGWLKAEVIEGDNVLCSCTEPVSLLARNEWCGLASLPEILAAFILPNDPAVMTILGRAAEVLRENTGRASFNGYQDKSRTRALEQAAALYQAIGELGLRYISPPASFENTGQKVRFPSDILATRFATCLDLCLLFAACCEQVGLHPLVLMHDGHAYGACWLDEQTFPEAWSDDLQHIRKLEAASSIMVFEATALASEAPGTLSDAELLAKPHLGPDVPFRLALDVRRARLARIHPLPIPGQATEVPTRPSAPPANPGFKARSVQEAPTIGPAAPATPATRIDQWKSRLLDLSLRNRLLNFKETKSTVRILSAAPDHVEGELAAERELTLLPKPRLMGEDDPRTPVTYTKQQREDALKEHLRDELSHKRLHTSLDEKEHSRRLTELFRAARNAIDENGTNTLFAAVGILEWKETEHSDRTLRAPLLLVPVELKRKSVLEGFSLRRIDEETRLNFTLMEMLRQSFHKHIPGLDPLPEDEDGVNVGLVFQIFRQAVQSLTGWEVKDEIWLGQFSFTKFLLWKDLTDRLDDLTRNKIVNHLVNEGGALFPNPPDDIKAPALDDRFRPSEVFCPRSADSSQLAAVMAAAAGQDFVLEGPPGTGKSQTITNIIAHCLAEGKRVLFVAEKRAALDVVHRRLREDGLEPFCLELHSNKIGKTDVLAQLDRALRFAASADGLGWDYRAAELAGLRSSLNGYARALHHRHACGLTPYQCLDYLLPRQSEPTVRFDHWPTILDSSMERLEKARELSRRLQDRSRTVAPLANHPLTDVLHSEWTPTWAERAAEEIDEVHAAAQPAMEAADAVRKVLRCPKATSSKKELERLGGLVDSLLAAEVVGGGFATTPWAELAPELDTWAAFVRERSGLRTDLRALHHSGDPHLPVVACETWSQEEAAGVFDECRRLEGVTRRTAEAARELRTWLKAPKPTATADELAALAALAASLSEPHPVGSAFATTPWHKSAADLEQWIALARERVELRERIKGYDEAKLLSLDLDAASLKWQSTQHAWFLPKALRTASVRRLLRTARPDQASPDISGLDALFVAAIRLKVVNSELAKSREHAEAVLGQLWRQGEPDADSMAKARSWGSQLHERLRTVAASDETWLQALQGLLASLFGEGPAAYGPGTPAGVRMARFREAAAELSEGLEAWLSRAAIQSEPLHRSPDHLGSAASLLRDILRAAPRLRKIDSDLNAASSLAQSCLGSTWAKGEPSAEAIAKAKQWGETLHPRISACAGDDLGWLQELRQLLGTFFAEGPASFGAGTGTGEQLARYRDTQDRFHSALDRLAASSRLRREGLDAAADHLAAVSASMAAMRKAWGRVHEWCMWQEVRHEGLKLGLAPIVALIEAPQGERVDVPGLFERSFRRALLFASIEREPALRGFLGQEHDERIERFRQMDAKLQALARELIRARLAGKIPREHDDDVPKQEMALLRRELGKKMRHVPVRKLIGGIRTLLPRLKPCVLMSPLSVAQYLDAGHDGFDVVIFDEASQIPVWDAVGAIARGRQLIVVGDPKQLPPTNFFTASDDDDDEADLAPDSFKDLESILDELMTNGLRHKRLQWHYRSRHEGLISFSNREYYDNELLTFPSPEADHGGVRFRHLANARYDKGKSRTNRVEAEALVAELVSRLREADGPTRSFGVVTFSQAQQSLVENLLDEERRKCPEIEIHFGDEPPVEGEPVFVKNLENVQGDERDVILFSICYGADESGRVSMNFGPLNRNGGERRLNVAVTRAKHEVVVFSGLRADQIDLARTRARGVRDLKRFLDYAERGPRALAVATTASPDAAPDSEFERMVADRVRAAGFEVHHQVGCSDYRIDLAVVDPAAPGRYLLGIECDGATYHRAATARDRDKLRQAVLEDLGWKLHRIWSTDWWHNAEREMEKLLGRLAELSAAAGRA